MKKIEQLTNIKSVSKTLRFRLIPQGNTQRFLDEKQIIETDEKLSNDYEKLKLIIAKYHREYIDNCLKSMSLSRLDEYATLYSLDTKSDIEIERMNDIVSSFKVVCHNALTENDFFKKVLFSDDLIKSILPNWDKVTEDEKEIIETFRNFTTYTVGYRDNLNNIYTNDNKSTEICYRLFNDNLCKFFDNYKCKEKVMVALIDSADDINKSLLSLWNLNLEEIFMPSFYNKILTQQGIDMYNQIVGGRALEDGTKIKGLNEYINLYCQQNKVKIPKLKTLFKQVLSEKSTESFIYEQISNDEELLDTIKSFDPIISYAFESLNKISTSIDSYDLNSIYIDKLYFTKVSQDIFGDWNRINESLESEYDSINFNKNKSIKSYEEKKAKDLKRIENISLSRINQISNNDVFEYIVSNINSLCENVQNTKNIFDGFNYEKGVANNESSIGVIKDYLDSLMALYHFLLVFNKSDKQYNDMLFYSDLDDAKDLLANIIPLYNKTRNYVTKKPYSVDKFKLNFGNSQLLDGWDVNKEKDYYSVLLTKDDLYYLAIMDKEDKKIFINPPIDEQDNYQKMYYKLLPDPSKTLPHVFFSAKGIKTFKPSKELIERKNRGDYKKGPNFDINFCHKLIDYFKQCMSLYDGWDIFNFSFSPTSQYNSINEFYDEVSEQGYSVSFKSVSSKYINELVSKGKLYLFEIYNKDFSKNKNSTGKDNLHTIYFKTLFSKENLEKPILKLNGKAEMFYRKKSIKDNIIVHKKNNPINNKNILNNKKTSTFAYDLIKDKRFTIDQMFLHLSVTFNKNAKEKRNISELVRYAIRNSDKNYVIGIDRGERNLLSVSVVDENANIVEQFSANIIENKYNNVNYSVDYHQLLDAKEKERKQSRESWSSIGKIKDLKEGYLSAIIHKICLLVEKYDAIIAIEDLNSGFMNSRKKFEKQVYQKFEKMLIDKLSFLVFKDNDMYLPGGVFNAYQLADSSNSFGKQNGFIFYVPASLTSKIDPTTGFVNLLHPKYENVDRAKDFFNKFDSIVYDSKLNMYAFNIDYSKFNREIDFKKKWSIYTNGQRIITFRNKDKNSEWDYKTINLTDEIDNLLSNYNIKKDNDIKTQLLDHSEKELFESLIKYLSITLQMRNSNSQTGEDYIISPVLNSNNEFYDSRKYNGFNAILPIDADANGAYNIALKGLIMLDKIKNSENLDKVDLKISQDEWLKYMQDR